MPLAFARQCRATWHVTPLVVSSGRCFCSNLESGCSRSSYYTKSWFMWRLHFLIIPKGHKFGHVVALSVSQLWVLKPPGGTKGRGALPVAASRRHVFNTDEEYRMGESCHIGMGHAGHAFQRKIPGSSKIIFTMHAIS